MLYKYLRKAHAEGLLTRGTVRIGTLYEYRDVEKHGLVVGDLEEGKRSNFLHAIDEVWTADDQPDFAKRFIRLGPNASVNLVNTTFERSEQSPDCYIFSMTQRFDASVMREFGYDSCVEIVNPPAFFEALSECIKDKASFIGLFNCAYADRRQPHTATNVPHPALLKDPKFSAQAEARAIWRPVGKEIGPEVIACAAISRFCKPHYGF